MSKLGSGETTAKCVEVSKCLTNKEPGFHDYDLDTTITTGDMARLATNLRQAGSLDEKQLAGVSNVLKIDYRTLRSGLLPNLEELGWVDVHGKGKRIKRVDETIPPLEDILTDLGKIWEENEPTQVDLATIKSLSALKSKPATKEALLSETGVSDEEFDNALNYGRQTRYFGTFQSSELEKEVVWTPFYWAGKVDKVLKFLDRQSYEMFDKIGVVARRFLKYPGRPLDQLLNNRNIINAGIYHGFFPSVGVEDRTGKKHEYVFAATPHFEPEPEKDIFEKARLIVACIRHGQHHSEITRIKYPVKLLRALKENRINPHSYSKIQYALLITNRICTYEEVERPYGKAYKPVFIDTPENVVAMEVAEEMLRGKDPVIGSVDEPQVKELLTKGMYNYSAEQRQVKSGEKITAVEEFDRLLEYVHGSGVTE
ncbi:MAG: hypothetical protein R6U44_00620 [Archaeoglobaceae archaeon]